MDSYLFQGKQLRLRVVLDEGVESCSRHDDEDQEELPADFGKSRGSNLRVHCQSIMSDCCSKLPKEIGGEKNGGDAVGKW